MRLVRVFVPGDYEDAYVYMGWLVALTSNRSLQLINLASAASRMDNARAKATPVATYMFARNDWLNSEQFKALLRNRDVYNQFLTALDEFAREDMQLAAGQTEEINLDLASNVVLDMRFYSSRLYIGADDGLFDFELDGEMPYFHHQPRKRLDARCMSLSTRFGAVNASCGNEGLFAGLHEFAPARSNGGDALLRLSQKSLRTGWLGHGIVNYETNSAASLFRIRTGKGDDERADEGAVITHVDQIPFSFDFLVDYLRHVNHVEEGDVQFTFNSTTTMFIHTYSGELFTLGLVDAPDRRPEVRFSKAHRGAGSRILSAAQCRAGIVVETDDKVLLFCQGEWREVIGTSVLSVRTFMTSKRFQNLIAVTTEGGIWLIGVFDESAYRPNR